MPDLQELVDAMEARETELEALPDGTAKCACVKWLLRGSTGWWGSYRFADVADLAAGNGGGEVQKSSRFVTLAEPQHHWLLRSPNAK